MSNRYFVGQGRVYAAVRTALGVPTGFLDLGNCPELVISPGLAAIPVASGGTEADPPAYPSGEPPAFKMQVENLNTINLTTFLYGYQTSVAGATVSESVVGYKGKTTPLANLAITTWISLTNDAGTITYTEGSDYTVNAEAGSIFIPVASTITEGQSLKANYTHPAQSNISAFTITPPFHWLRFEGLNNAENNAPVVVDIFKTRIRPADELPLIGDTVASMRLSGRIYYDSTQPDTTLNGRYFRIRMP